MTKSLSEQRPYNATVMLTAMPARIRSLPISEQGYPVPWFVPWQNGKPITQAADPQKMRLAMRRGVCWVCGQKLGVYKAFLIGPMCAVNRTTAEPPQHRECAEYAAKVCPFLIKPAMKRNPVDDARKQNPAGLFIERNPGVCLVWITRSYKTFNAPGGVLFSIGEPLKVIWYREGRMATRGEVLVSMHSGLPILLNEARREQAEPAVQKLFDRALKLIPEESDVPAP
jgi:hypothetical protein